MLTVTRDLDFEEKNLMLTQDQVKNASGNEFCSRNNHMIIILALYGEI